MDGNRLTRFPNLKGLTMFELHLENNNIDLVEGDFEGLSIKQLYLDNNNISTISPLLQALVLERISLDNNSIRHTGDTEYRLLESQPKLRYLSLNNCSLTTFLNNQAMEIYVHVQTAILILLKYNKLTRMPNLKGLQIALLDVRDNAIVLRADDFKDVTINSLRLSNNKVTNLLPIAKLHDSLHELTLDSNDLSQMASIEIYQTLLSLPNLYFLSLQSCNLSTFPDVQPVDWTNGFQLYLSGNPFTCDCRLVWMKYPLIQDNSSIICTLPQQFDGITFGELDEEDLCTGELSLLSLPDIIITISCRYSGKVILT